jgi:short-subunit dehydrogenase
MKVNNKVIVVTGGGNGIGREMVLLLLSRGATVAAVDINEPALQETIQLAGDKKGNLSTFIVNITDRKAVEALPAQIIAKHGVVDGIINNAGIIQPFVKLNDLGYDAIERVMNVNLYGALYMVKAFLPILLERPVAHIVNIASMGAFLPVPGQTIYGASKAAMMLMTEGLYAELMDTNVKVTVVFPGSTSTNIMANSGLANAPKADENTKTPFKLLTPKKSARIIVDGMEKDRFRVMAGRDAKFLDIMCRLNPKMATRLISKLMKSLMPS